LGGAVLTPLMNEAARGAIVTIWSIAYLVALSALLALLVWTRARQRVALSSILAAGLAGVVVLNFLDLGRWLGWLDYDNLTFAHFHVALVLFAIGATIAERHFKAISAVERSNVELEIQVAEKTREIEANYQRLRDAERERVLANERSRIMADMHDGVGASLLGLLGTVQSGKAEPEAVRRRVHEAMLELRLAVDSLGPVDGDLAVVLGNVRHRMREPIEESGVRFQWLVGELPPVAYLTPKAILAIQRTVLEAIANALRHARARTIAVRTEVDDPGGRLLIHVIDDGTGFDPAAVGRGRGLDNLHNRAQGIGASVEIDSRAEAGTRVTLILPQAPP
ncbi:MAG TPA: ATP-binding protein, partial [Stellaceae bacterium]|nr:ATP-binding protein [Stellaceae bacterium]